MKRISRFVVPLLAVYSSFAQRTPEIVTSSYSLVQPFNVAPGQLITLVVDLGPASGIYETARAPSGVDLPTSLGGITGGFYQVLGVGKPSPFLEVYPYWGSCGPTDRQYCTSLAAITIQIPFEAKSPGPGGPLQGTIDFGGAPFVFVDVVADQVHLLTTCDAFMIPQSFSAPGDGTGLPCPSIVAHGDGSLVSAQSPALPGEVVVAYAVGLGQTDPPLQTGKIVTAPAQTQATFGLDFNYHPNALASKPLPNAPPPLYSGATPGFVGLYQINFAVPSPPPGTPPCVVPKTPGENVVYSNLTVTVGGAFSFDAARLCVAVNP